MSDAKHTPGPWYVMNSHKPGFVNVYGTHNIDSVDSMATTFVCEVGPTARTADSEASANAALIARAPALVAECERLTSRINKLTASRQLYEQARIHAEQECDALAGEVRRLRSACESARIALNNTSSSTWRDTALADLANALDQPAR